MYDVIREFIESRKRQRYTNWKIRKIVYTLNIRRKKTIIIKYDVYIKNNNNKYEIQYIISLLTV